MILSIILIIIELLIGFKCCENFSKGNTFLIFLGLSSLFRIISNPVGIISTVIVCAMFSAIQILVMYTIYEHSNNSFWKFFAIYLLITILFALAIRFLFVMFVIWLFSGMIG